MEFPMIIIDECYCSTNFILVLNKASRSLSIVVQFLGTKIWADDQE